MKPELSNAVFNLTLAMAKAEATPEEPEQTEADSFDDEHSDMFDENGRPTILLLDDIWEIIDNAGDGTAAIIHHDGAPDEVVIYNRSASQHDNVVFMEHIYLAIDEGCLVTVNGTDILDLY